MSYKPLHVKQAEASSELIHNLSLASASITRFQDILFSESAGTTFSGSSQLTEGVLGHLRAATFPSPVSTHPYSQAMSTAPAGESFPGDNRVLSRQCSSSPSHRHRSPSSVSECCGGIFDCRDLIEKDVTHDIHDMQHYSPIGRLSGLRSTSNISINDLPSN